MTKKEFMDEIVEKSLHRDYTWMKSMQEKGLLLINSRKLTAELFKQFSIIIKTFSEIYEDNWEISFSVVIVGDEYGISIRDLMVHFAEVPITNSKGIQHTIKDLFVKLIFSSPSTKIGIADIQGTRTTITKAEYDSCYVHSHLHSLDYRNNNMVYWTSFCLGSGEINTFLADINSEGVTEERFQKLFLQLYSLVSWESIEGTPYKYIADIRERNQESRSSAYTSRGEAIRSIASVTRNVLFLYKTENRNIDLDIYLENGTYKITNNHKVEEFFLYGAAQRIRKIYLSYKDITTGNMYSLNYLTSQNEDEAVVTGPSIMFRNKKYRPTVIKEEKEEDIFKITESDYSIENYIKEKIIKYLEDELNKKKYRKSTINRYKNQDDNVREGVESN